jgi:hypothetical protein
MRLHRDHDARFAYLAKLPPAQQNARRAIHEALTDAIAIEKVVKAARRERRIISRRTVHTLAPLSRGPSRGGGIST